MITFTNIGLNLVIFNVDVDHRKGTEFNIKSTKDVLDLQ